MHLARVRVAELAHLEVDDDKATQAAVKEDEVDTKPVIVDAKPPLAAKKRKIISQFQQKVRQVLNKRLLQI